MKNRFVLILLLSSIFCLAQSSQAERINIKSFIDSAANRIIKKPLIHSTSIAIVYKGKEFIGHYGELEKGKNNCPNNETIYEIGSLSKTFAGTLAAEAVIQNKLNIEEDIQKYLPEDYPNLKYGKQPILIKHLLSHTSGLPNMLPLEANTILENFTSHDTPAKINELYKNYSEKDFLRDLHKVKIDSVPGYKYQYSSTGSQLIAFVL